MPLSFPARCPHRVAFRPPHRHWRPPRACRRLPMPTMISPSRDSRGQVVDGDPCRTSVLMRCWTPRRKAPATDGPKSPGPEGDGTSSSREYTVTKLDKLQRRADIDRGASSASRSRLLHRRRALRALRGRARTPAGARRVPCVRAPHQLRAPRLSARSTDRRRDRGRGWRPSEHPGGQRGTVGPRGRSPSR